MEIETVECNSQNPVVVGITITEYQINTCQLIAGFAF